MKNHIGHNSVQVPHNGVYTPFKALTSEEQKAVNDDLWAHYEARKRSCRPLAVACRERQRLVKKGVIKPLVRYDGLWSVPQPQMMIKDDNGRWVPQLKFVEK